MRRARTIRVIALLLAAMPAAAAVKPTPKRPAPPADPAARLHDLFDREWKWRLAENPLFATSVGVHDFDAKLPEVLPKDEERRARTTQRFLGELRGIPTRALSDEDRTNAAIFDLQLSDALLSFRFREYEIPLTADWGFQTELTRLPDEMPFRTIHDYENYVARLNAIPRYVEERVADMQEGLARGMTVPKVVLAGIDQTIIPHVVAEAEKSVWWKPFEKFPSAVSPADRKRLAADGRKAILESAVPAFRKLAEFLDRDYVPHARTTLAASALPGGRAYYDFAVRRFTTRPMTADQVHQIGLSEVKRIHAEMEAVIRQTGFTGDFKAFLEFLRTDPRFYARTPEELLERASWICKRMDGKLPSLFKTLPRLPYGVAPVPPEIAPKFTGGRYIEAPVGSTQPGYFWVNTYRLDQRPLYTLEALALHESVPGHHLQIALSQELKDLPNFRRYSYISAFGEGWGLYCEHLGLEAGFYTDPYSNFGRLTYEMWRACRLVVDTGIHAMGWTREQAIDYLASHTALSHHEVETEIDRYIAWPGQALSYKIGELEIEKLRRKAEKALGPKFDVREFHDAVLLHGAVPLPVLDRQIDRYIAAHRAASPAELVPDASASPRVVR
ncbi:MAG TPA: DUF885 domain-containing protein [Thermoanaerobaculia bacterium]|nr:DUF885 domain-containing protein [Thermoanaerobaculia bacterium]